MGARGAGDRRRLQRGAGLIGRRTVLAIAATVLSLACAAVAPSLVRAPAGWSRPPGLSNQQVLAAARDWLESCSRRQGGHPSDCPQVGEGPDPGAGFSWGPGDPAMKGATVAWVPADGLFWVRGHFEMLAYYLPSGRTPVTGSVDAPFSAGLRPVSDTRDFGAHSTAGLPVVDGFYVKDYLMPGWRWQCCPGRTLSQ